VVRFFKTSCRLVSMIEGVFISRALNLPSIFFVSAV
jgi:hypothetical protein